MLLAAFSLPVIETGKGECATEHIPKGQCHKGDISGCSPLASGRVGVNAVRLWGALCRRSSPGLSVGLDKECWDSGVLLTASSTKVPAGSGEEGW